MTPDPAQAHFLALPAERQREVLMRLRARGYDDAALADMTGLGIERIARLISDLQ